MQQVHGWVFLALRRTFQMSAHATIAQNFPERVTLECDNCHLVQFETASKSCRKCHAPYAQKETVAPLPEAIDRPAPAGRSESGVDVATAVLVLRHWRGWSQRRTAAEMGVPRTYISKVECRHTTPNLRQVDRIAATFGCYPSDLIQLAMICGAGYL